MAKRKKKRSAKFPYGRRKDGKPKRKPGPKKGHRGKRHRK